MTATPPQLIRTLAFITQRLAKASRDAELRPSKVHQQRVRSLEMLAAACVSEAARTALRQRAAPARPRLEPELPPSRGAEAEPPPAGEEVTDARGVWSPPGG